MRNSTFPRRQIDSLRKVQQAGGKLQTVLIQELVQAVPNGQVYVMYGQTEATARLSYLPPELLKTKLGSIGRGVPGVTLGVVNESGVEVKPAPIAEVMAGTIVHLLAFDRVPQLDGLGRPKHFTQGECMILVTEDQIMMLVFL